MAEVDRVAEDEGLKQSLTAMRLSQGRLWKGFTVKKWNFLSRIWKQFLDGILHIYDEGRTL